MSIQRQNLELAEQLKIIGDLSQLESAWKAKAYYKAADVIRSLDVPISKVGDLESLPGVGKGISKKINQILDTGTCDKLVSLQQAYPNAMEAMSMTIVPGIGLKKALAYAKDGIRNFDELVDACDTGLIDNERIIQGVRLAQRSRGRLPINEVIPVVIPILRAIHEVEGVRRAEFAGSVRRGRETVRDVDILVSAADRQRVREVFLPFGQELVNGEAKSRIFVPIDGRTSVQVDLMFVEPESWGAAIAYFTGSKEHNVALRTLANRKGMTVNEHGFYTLEGKKLGGEEEHELYNLLGIPFYPPELREGNDVKDEIPNLITREDIWGDFHMHTTYSSDARDSVEDMVHAAKRRGLRMIGITDHVEKNYGWQPEDIPKRFAEIKAAAQKHGITSLSGAEVGVNADGSLIDRIDLEQQEYIIASIHRRHAENPVDRLIEAMKHPKVKFIGHPTGRSLGRREVPDEDWDKLYTACAENDVALEINGARLDLPDSMVRRAKQLGCKFVLNSDAHATDQLVWQDYAVLIARRAGLGKEDLVIPTEEE